MFLLHRLQNVNFFHLLEGENFQCIVFGVFHKQNASKASNSDCCERFQIFKLDAGVFWVEVEREKMKNELKVYSSFIYYSRMVSNIVTMKVGEFRSDVKKASI